MKYEDLIEKKIDEIYSEIIITLIKKNKFEDYEYTYNIIQQLDLESIDITDSMFEEINNLLNNDEEIKNKYIISKVEDLFDDKKLNFYFILFKYILKDSYFIYIIEYLYKIKRNIILILNKNSFENIEKLNENQKMKLNKLLEIFLDSKFYINKYSKLKLIDLTNINNKKCFNKEENKKENKEETIYFAKL